VGDKWDVGCVGICWGLMTGCVGICWELIRWKLCRYMWEINEMYCSSTTFRFDGQLSSEIPENWRTGKVPNINSPCSRTLFNSKLYWKRWCKRLPCSNGEDENVLHRRSNVNEIVSAGGKTSYQNARQLNRWITEKEPWQRAAIYVIFYGFYTIPSSAFDWSWDKTWAKHTAAT